jgi:hypothetical protein
LETDAKCNVYLAKLKQDIENSLENRRSTSGLQLPPSGKGNNKIAPVGEGETVVAPPVSSKEDLELLSVIASIKGYESVNES